MDLPGPACLSSQSETMKSWSEIPCSDGVPSLTGTQDNRQHIYNNTRRKHCNLLYIIIDTLTDGCVNRLSLKVEI